MEYSNSQIREIISEYIHSERDRKIMIRRLVDDVTLERLAEEFQLSVSQTKRIVWKHSETIYKHIRK